MTQRQESYSIGNMTIQVQDESLYNADYYSIHTSQLGKDQPSGELLRVLQQKVEDPERIIIEESGSGPVIYSRQPDAILGIAMELNKHMDVAVPTEELERLREALMIQQTNGGLQ